MAKHPDIDTAWVTLNRACNLRCRWCYAASTAYGAGDDMPFELFRGIIDLVCELGVRKVTLTGGEPTIYPRALEAVQYCKVRGLDVTIPTNGLAFASRDRLEQFCRAGVNRIGMSVKLVLWGRASSTDTQWRNS
ncbi:MAG: radical SAM protein [Atopobiaceae bacterium]|nr:radical SAM protein [Atopobiaceae bacterium]